MGGTVAAAPPTTNFTPDGCGLIAGNSELCVNGGTVGKAGTYKFKVSYNRGTAGQITVRLGIDRDNSAYKERDWFGHTKTKGVGQLAEISHTQHIVKDDCIRGIMSYKGKAYVTKWRCP
ncbi:hypothetical protein OG754_01045 [Streptomyces decoyicus]|uniref:hypothetical protein n=1 Tax=Streptomyces decoyicus TaxID=249567 RepID=UPI002E2F186F|nr:hypothetical protein [Streptomyces decoyicus]